jgi:Protein of unknown function (DUF3396)
MALLPLRFPPAGPPYDARDGVIVVFFARESHRSLAPTIGALLDAYLALVGEGSLAFIVSSEEWKPLTPRRRANARRRLSPAAANGLPNAVLEMKGGCGEDDVGAYGFYYYGHDLAESASKRETSAVELWFPTEVVEQRGLDAFTQDVLTLASHVPFSCGYCSLAFNLEDGAWMDVKQLVTTPLAMRHPGMDVHRTVITTGFMGDGIRGAYWLTLVGPVALQALELDADGICEALDDSAITVYELARGVAIRAGDELRPGDVNYGDRLPLTRKVAAVLEPVTIVQERGAFGFATDDPLTSFLEWQRRHLD